MQETILKKWLTKFFFMWLCGIILAFFAVNSTFAETTEWGKTEANTARPISEWSSPNFKIQLNDLDPIEKSAPSTSDITPETSTGGGWKMMIQNLFEKIANFLLLIIPIVAVVSLVIAGYFYIFSFSSDEFVTKAKTIIKYNLIAIIVAFGSWAIISTMAKFFW